MQKGEAVEVRHMRAADIAQVIEVQDRVYPGTGGFRRDQLESQLIAFPLGQVVACRGRRVVGAASSLIVKWDDYGTGHTWKEVTGGGYFTTHDPGARTLYGAEVFSDPEQRRLGIGKKLYEARRRLCRALNLRRIMACGRLPNYHRHAERMTPEDYAMRVIWGDVEDNVLLFQLRQGFQYCGVIRGYLPSDQDSAGHATIIVWLNERYQPGEPTAAPKGPIL
jgi:GNAT superfamily N-acetyltransferase